MANQQPVRFREAAVNGVNHIAIQAPAVVSADQVLTLPDQTGTVVTTGDNGSVTSTMILDGTILNADINASAGIVDTKLATISTAGKVSNSATTATNANTTSAIVARDASGNFSAGTITANLTGTASNVTTNANFTGDITSVGNATSIAAGVIVNADINASAAIADSKLTGTTCKAWVNFNGVGTVSIRADFNVSSITDNAVGDYTVNFSNAMVDTNYAVNVTAGGNFEGAMASLRRNANSGYATGSIRVFTNSGNNSNNDMEFVSVSVFR